jgi:hypothetical protein
MTSRCSASQEATDSAFLAKETALQSTQTLQDKEPFAPALMSFSVMQSAQQQQAGKGNQPSL